MREWDDGEPLGWGFRLEATFVTGLVCLGLLFVPTALISFVVRIISGHL